MKNRLLALGTFLLLAGCTVPGTYISPGSISTPPPAVDQHWMEPTIVPIDANLLQKKAQHSGFKVFKEPPEYRIGDFDALDIIVWDHPELSYGSASQAAISVDQMSVTSVSNAPVLGQPQARAGFQVDSHGYIYFPYAGKLKVSGLTLDQTRALLTRRLSKYVRNPQISVNISVYRSRQVFMIGELNQQGILSLTDKPISLFDAINRSGGIRLESADASHMYVIRANPDNTLNVYWLNAKTPEALVLSEHFYLRPNDIIYVTPVGVASWNRVVSQIMPTLQTLWYTKAMIKG